MSDEKVKGWLRELLLIRLREISERCWCAGWLIDLEYRVWGLAAAGGGEYGQGEISAEEAADLIDLSRAAGGWWINTGKPEYETRFVTTDEWLALLTARDDVSRTPSELR